MDLLTILIVILIVAWLMGVGGVFAAGNAIHLLLVLVLVIIAIRLLQGRSVL